MFLARFKPETYVLTPRPDNMIEIRPALPEEVEQKRQASQAEAEFRLLSNSMALQARQILNSGVSLTADKLLEFFQQLQRIQQPEYPDWSEAETRTRLQSIAGGLAVLFIYHRAWLSENEDAERWCFDVLRNLQDAPSEEHEGPESGDLGHQCRDISRRAWASSSCRSDRMNGSSAWRLRELRASITPRRVCRWRERTLREGLGETFDELILSFSCGPLSGEPRPGKPDITLKGRFSPATRQPSMLVFSMAGSGAVRSRSQWRPGLGQASSNALSGAIRRRSRGGSGRRQRKALDRNDRDRDASRDMAHIDYQVIGLASVFCRTN